MNFQSNQIFFSPATADGYNSFCSSSDFQIIACAHGSGIYMSYDYGVTFVNTDINNRDWRDICCSSDGKYIYAFVRFGSIWYSSNYGITFTQASNTGSRAWFGCCCSTNGQLVYGVVDGGKIWWSNNYGVNWYELYNSTQTIEETTVDTTMEWKQICCNDSGNILFVTSRYPNNGSIYRISLTNPSSWTTTVGTTSWTVFAGASKGATDLNTNYTGTRYFRGIKCNSLGTRVVASIDYAGNDSTNHGLIIFNNNSATPTATGWTFTRALNESTVTSTTPSPSHTTSGAYVSIGCSRDFKNIITADYEIASNKNWYCSIDYGVTWNMVYDGNYLWHGINVCDNKFIIGSNDSNKAFIGQLYSNSSLYTIGGASFEQLIASGQSYGVDTGIINTITTTGVYPIYSFAFNNTTGSFEVKSNGIEDSFTFSKGGPIATDISFSYTNPTTSSSKNYYNTTTDNRKYLSINNSQSYVSTKTEQAYIQSGSFLLDYFYSFSISFWIFPYNVAAVNNYISLINITNANSFGCIDIAIDGTEKQVVCVLNNNFESNKSLCSTKLDANSKWYHITTTYNASTGYNYLYLTYNDPVTGKTQSTGVKIYNPGTVPNFYKAVLIGIRYGYNSSESGYKGYNGLIGNLNFYPRELTFGEVNSIYDAGLNASGLTYTTNITLNKFYENSNMVVKGQAYFGESEFSMVKLSDFYKLTNNEISMTQDSYSGMFSPYYTIYTTGVGTSDTQLNHKLQSWTKYTLILCIGGGGGGGCGNYENNGDTGGAGGGGAGGGLVWMVIDATTVENGNLTIQYGSGGEGGNGGGYDNTVYVGGNGLNGKESYVKAIINGEMVNLCSAHGGAKAYNKYNNIYNNRTPNNTDTDVTYSQPSSTPTATWPNNYNWYVDENTLYVKGTPKTNTSSTSVSRGANRTYIKSQQGGNGGKNGSVYTGVTDINGNPITTSDTTTSTLNLYLNSAYKINNFGEIKLGNDGANGQNDPGSASGQGGSGGNSGLYNSDGSYFKINNKTFVLDSLNTKFIKRENGLEITNGSLFKTIGKGGDGGNGENNSGVGAEVGFKGNDGAVFIVEYSILPNI